MTDDSCSSGVCEIKTKPEMFYIRNFKRLRAEVSQLCKDNGREANSCRIIPVSKTISPNTLRYFCEHGENVFGENKIQEMKRKHILLSDLNPEWHYIGHLQSNKVRECLEIASIIHSVDRLKLAVALDRHLQKSGKSISILIQVNTSNESSKFGVLPDESIALVREISKLKTLKIKGLMTLATLSKCSPLVRNCFKQLKTLADQIKTEAIDGVEMSELSMGMTSDYKIAIEEGATMIRVGQGIFGPRSIPDSFYWNEGNL